MEGGPGRVQPSLHSRRARSAAARDAAELGSRQLMSTPVLCASTASERDDKMQIGVAAVAKRVAAGHQR